MLSKAKVSEMRGLIHRNLRKLDCSTHISL
jgi:hypothetical protein